MKGKSVFTRKQNLKLSKGQEESSKKKKKKKKKKEKKKIFQIAYQWAITKISDKG